MNRKLISMTVCCILLCAASVARAQTYQSLHVFSGGAADGLAPYAGLIQMPDGTFYGTTVQGGASDCGTVFTTDGSASTPSILHSFSGADGCAPVGGLLFANDGFFYGTTIGGGQYDSGTVFRMSANGDVTVLHSFDATVPADGAQPFYGLIQGSDNLFYGTTSTGGAYGYGIAFRADRTGAITVLHSFGADASDGQTPSSPLIQAADGSATFYGTTLAGGNPNPPDCDPCDRIPGGTVYEMAVTGDVGSVFNRFNFQVGGGNGDTPFGGLVQTSPTQFYGTTSSIYGLFNGAPVNGGTIFLLDTSADFSGLYTVHEFPLTAPPYDGGLLPFASLMRSGDGNLYGTTAGLPQGATIFRLHPDGSQVDILHVFDATDPADPAVGTAGPLVEGIDGNIYGGTSGSSPPFFGAANDPGTLFRLNVDVSGVVKTNQTIAFGALADKTVGDADFLVPASASSGLTVSFAASGNCSVSGAMVHLGAAGNCTITASQAGTAYVSAAADVPRSFTIAKLAATLALSNLNQVYDGTPKSVTVTTTPNNLPGVTVTYNGSTALPTGPESFTVVASLSNPIYQASNVGGTLVITSPAPAVTLSLSAASVIGGITVTGTVTLPSPAAAGAVVTLGGAPGVATVPASIAIPKGKTSKTFVITTLPVGVAVTVNISATSNGHTVTAPLTVNPASVSALVLRPNAVKGGTAASATVTLNGPAPAGGLLVTLTSSNPGAAAGARVTVPANAATATAAIVTSKVTAQIDVTITATAGGTSKSATLIVKK
jgi:uncharacterized repeat protein (TIGR03803 family)